VIYCQENVGRTRRSRQGDHERANQRAGSLGDQRANHHEARGYSDLQDKGETRQQIRRHDSPYPSRYRVGRLVSSLIGICAAARHPPSLDSLRIGPSIQRIADRSNSSNVVWRVALVECLAKAAHMYVDRTKDDVNVFPPHALQELPT